MKIVLVQNSKLPVTLYGGTERVVWSLGKALSQLGHKVVFVCQKVSDCDFAEIIDITDVADIASVIPKDADIIHYHSNLEVADQVNIPYLFTLHGNIKEQAPMNKNVVFVSKSHAERYGSDSYVYNGLDWNDYTTPDFSVKREGFHFLGKAAWRIKNVKGAITIIRKIKSKLKVLGGYRFNISMGIRFTFSPRILFYGMIGGVNKDKLVNSSKGLLFPVRWHEPFGLAIIESLYYGCPVFGTPYGSLPELITPEYGFLSNSSEELAKAMLKVDNYDRMACHEYAKTKFSAIAMAENYLVKYNIVLSGKTLNTESPMLKESNIEKFLPWY